MTQAEEASHRSSVDQVRDQRPASAPQAAAAGPPTVVDGEQARIDALDRREENLRVVAAMFASIGNTLRDEYPPLDHDWPETDDLLDARAYRLNERWRGLVALAEVAGQEWKW